MYYLNFFHNWYSLSMFREV